MTDFDGVPRAAGASQPAGAAPRDPVAGKSVSEVFGEIVWLMTQDKHLKVLPLSDLEWLVMPPILLRQFRIFYAPPKAAPAKLDEAGRPLASGSPAGAAEAPPPTQPVGAVLFAMASDAVASALDADAGAKLRLTPGDWRSGRNKRVVRVIAPFGGAQEMLAQLREGTQRPGAADSQRPVS